MATTYRLQKTKYNNAVLSGDGASISGGRWNAPGTPLIYTSTSISLAILEARVHLDNRLLPRFPALNIIVLEIPDECIHQFTRNELSSGWDSVPAVDCTQLFLAPLLDPRNKLAFSVPSVVNPFENNILINPLHPDISRVIIQNTVPFAFDHRLITKLSLQTLEQ